MRIIVMSENAHDQAAIVTAIAKSNINSHVAIVTGEEVINVGVNHGSMIQHSVDVMDISNNTIDIGYEQVKGI